MVFQCTHLPPPLPSLLEVSFISTDFHFHSPRSLTSMATHWPIPRTFPLAKFIQTSEFYIQMAYNALHDLVFPYLLTLMFATVSSSCHMVSLLLLFKTTVFPFPFPLSQLLYILNTILFRRLCLTLKSSCLSLGLP